MPALGLRLLALGHQDRAFIEQPPDVGQEVVEEPFNALPTEIRKVDHPAGLEPAPGSPNGSKVNKRLCAVKENLPGLDMSSCPGLLSRAVVVAVKFYLDKTAMD